ncbi:tRNA (adenosine(37)-N6)-threonylcarbamoyltransferase complex ATPase subunit type 1 TsaE [Salegentibacter flavus]|uniref:tRNA threonylcarbamoyladenosine biosynthesis protein TsaE n=1 Tax=Salegentibacter flavus TaxID=287099 RepID=A0A1I5CPI3_9FLAO|nr:tRNA (adenosine(37)-N6)-threonylcarbamoyltransferase complex ATPase subunit type 1 TsaE [Salegentibacter flavus]SFN88909.1 tRNA threonylcarbamoyladenosine biosynthesis protein TsaE [Salegentibacter flavus]
MPLTYNLNEIDLAVDYILKNAKNKTLLFYGEMGAGKTTLIRALVKALGSEDLASSPTFSLVNEYSSTEGPIYHFDFYRIEDENEALDMGIEDYFESPGWKLIEWPQKIENLLEPEWQKIELKIKDENLRVLNIC